MLRSPILEPMKNEKTENAGSQVHHKYKLQFPGETGTTILAIMHGPCTKTIRIAVAHFCLIFKVGASSVGATRENADWN